MFTTLVFLCLSGHVSSAGAPAELRYKGHGYVLSELPPEIGAPPREAAAGWADWAGQRGYALELLDDQRLIFAYPKNRSSAAAEIAKVEAVAKLFDRLSPPAPQPSNPAGQVAPPQEPPAKQGPVAPAAGDSASAGEHGLGAEGASTSWSWSTERPVDSQTAVLLELRDGKDYASALALLAGRHDYLKSWAGSAGKHIGFVLSEPLCAAWIVKAPKGVQEWSAEAEMINRAAQLYLLRHHGVQPYWITMGLAWHIEHELRGGIYCFPYRDGFVFAAEHSGWERELEERFEKRATDPLQERELCAFPHGTYDQEHAQAAWGAVGFLAKHYPDALPKILEDFRVYRSEKGKTVHPDGTWEMQPDFEIPVADQYAILKKNVAEDVLEQMSQWFAKGKGWRKPGK